MAAEADFYQIEARVTVGSHDVHWVDDLAVDAPTTVTLQLPVEAWRHHAQAVIPSTLQVRVHAVRAGVRVDTRVLPAMALTWPNGPEKVPRVVPRGREAWEVPHAAAIDGDEEDLVWDGEPPADLLEHAAPLQLLQSLGGAL